MGLRCLSPGKIEETFVIDIESDIWKRKDDRVILIGQTKFPEQHFEWITNDKTTGVRRSFDLRFNYASYHSCIKKYSILKNGDWNFCYHVTTKEIAHDIGYCICVVGRNEFTEPYHIYHHKMGQCPWTEYHDELPFNIKNVKIDDPFLVNSILNNYNNITVYTPKWFHLEYYGG